MNTSVVDKITSYFAQKAAGGTKSLEEYLGMWPTILEEAGNLDGVIIPPDAQVSNLLKSRTIQRNGVTFYSIGEGRFVNANWELVAKTTMPASVQVRIALALGAQPTNMYGGWFAPTKDPGWQELYVKTLADYEQCILAKCANDPTSLKVLLALYQKDTEFSQ